MKIKLSVCRAFAPLLLASICAASEVQAQSAAPQPAPKTAPAASSDRAAVLLKLAGALEAAGKHDQAVAAYEKVADLYTAQAKALEKEADDLKAAGQEDAAKAKYGQAADKYGLAADASEKQANILLRDLAPAANDAPVAPAAPAPVEATPANAAPAQPAPANPAPTKPVKLAPLAPKAGTMSGRVVTEAGDPVPSFTVKYFGFQDGVVINNGAETVNAEVRGSGGAYSIKVPPGAYGASAYVTYEYQGRSYKFTAEPLNPPNQYDYPGKRISNLNGGLVRDFILRMSTKKDGAQEDTESGYFDAYGGGTILFDSEHLGAGDQAPPPLYATIGARPYSPDSRLLVTLTPQGPMVDGSTGRVVHINVRLDDSNGHWQGSQRGIYPGIYSATATLSTPAGETVPLRLGVQNSRTSPSVNHMEWTPSVTVDFLPFTLGLRGGLQTVKLFPAK